MTECPCCHQQVEVMPIDSIADYAPLTPYERRVFTFLAEQFGKYVPNRRVINHLYSGQRNGGPDNAEQNFRVFRRRIQAKISQYGLTIEGRQTREYDGGTTRLSWTNGGGHAG